MNRKATSLIISLLFLTILSGCLGGRITSPSTDYVQGRVEFHDTGLGISSTVTVGSETVITDYGKFTLAMEPGVYPYTIQTYLGE